MESHQEQFDTWALVDLFGHQRIAGRVREATIGGSSFIRVDVPGGGTRFFGGAAIYSISPMTEELARKFAEGIDATPVKEWEMPRARRVLARAIDLDDELDH